ncbi:MAG: hypothetical protein U0797_27670 [Gemmataceae bacterium]
MRDGLFGVVVSLALNGIAYGAAPPSRLDRVLRDWASASEQVRAAEYRFTLTEHDKSFGTKTTRMGIVRFCKPDHLRVDYLQGRGAASSCVFTPEAIHLLDVGNRTECVLQWPRDRSFLGATEAGQGWRLFGLAIRDGLAQEVYWRFLGLPPLELPKHFRLRLTKEDASYVYLEGTPRRDWSKGYRFLQVVLTRKEHRVRRLYWQVANGSTYTFDIEGYDPAALVAPKAIRDSLPGNYKRLEMAK